MVKLGRLNSRMKDFYDIWTMARMFEFESECLAKAIQKTFKNRNTAIVAHPQVFDSSFCNDKSKQVQWRAFLRKTRLENAPDELCKIVYDIEKFLKPVLEVTSIEEMPKKKWIPPGG